MFIIIFVVAIMNVFFIVIIFQIYFITFLGDIETFLKNWSSVWDIFHVGFFSVAIFFFCNIQITRLCFPNCLSVLSKFLATKNPNKILTIIS